MDNNYKYIVAGYSNEELLLMVYQFNEWHTEMLIAVEAELKDRNILPDDILQRKNIVIQQEHDFLLIGKEATFPQQFLGWIGVFGILGLIIGNHLAFSKTISKYTGKEYFKYEENSRESGRYMFYVSAGLIALFIFYKSINFIERL